MQECSGARSESYVRAGEAHQAHLSKHTSKHTSLLKENGAKKTPFNSHYVTHMLGYEKLVEKTIVVVHLKLALELRNGIHRNAYHNEDRRTTKRLQERVSRKLEQN